MDRGTDSIDTVLNTVLFSILPTLVDIAIAVVYFTVSFGSYFGLTVFVTMTLYILFTIAVTVPPFDCVIIFMSCNIHGCGSQFLNSGWDDVLDMF